MPTFPVDQLRHLATAMLMGVGTPNDLARIVGDSLVDANLAGHDSHGILRLPSYVESVRRGAVQPAPAPRYWGAIKPPPTSTAPAAGGNRR